MHPDTNGLPHVTTILARAGLVDATWFTTEARDRGTALHMAAQFMDDGDLDWNTVAPDVLPRLRAYQRFKDEVKPEILAIEEPVENLALRYCGRLDRRVRINGREGVLDLKSPAFEPWQCLQTALYAACFPRPMARWTLHLADHRYTLIEHKDRRDWEVAKAAITLAAWKESHRANGSE